jgi:hypothetical protein
VAPALGLETEGPDLARRRGLGSLTCSAMLFHRTSIAPLSFSMTEPGSVLGVDRRHAGEISIVEEIDSSHVRRLDLGLLGECLHI